MNLFVCIHGHFYQPPRENPWLESIELQDSAYPYHDWNERITDECYGPNAESRVLDSEGWITSITNNYSRISFNFGPTLLAWMKDHAPGVYRAVLDADRKSAERFSGHGSAMAQAYNHLIMPLANRRDKMTQVAWGIADFQHRFGRFPEGMWLPETAVDLETLDILSEQGIAFTVLAPHQAGRVRRVGGRNWRDVTGQQIDPRRPYFARLQSGRTIAVFFYDGPIARAVAFEGLLASGDAFADRLLGGFSDDREEPQMVHIATDGETYGHHHRFGEMALAAALERFDRDEGLRLTNYAEHLAEHPPVHEVEIIENTSWSCEHGIERWRSDCGCATGQHPGWHQRWRAPLRDALDELRDATAPGYEREAARLLRNPWKARDDYIRVVLDRTDENVSAFFADHAERELRPDEIVTALKLLELQRHAMLMYTSCGWFFDDISGIESTQVIQYAGRVIQLAQELLGDNVEANFLAGLEAAEGNVLEHRNGREVYEHFVRPARVDLVRVAAHFAIDSLFEGFPDKARLYCYRAESNDVEVHDAGANKLALGRVRLTSEITREEGTMEYGALHLGDHNVDAGVRPDGMVAGGGESRSELREAFSHADLPGVVRLLDRDFGPETYSMTALFRDEQRKIVASLLASTLAEAEAAYVQLHEHHAPLMRFLVDANHPLPKAFQTSAELSINADLRKALESDEVEPARVAALLEEAPRWHADIDEVALSFTLDRTIERLAQAFGESPEDAQCIDRLASAARLATSPSFTVDLGTAQNRFYEALHAVYPALRGRAEGGDQAAKDWLERFVALGELLRVRVEWVIP